MGHTDRQTDKETHRQTCLHRQTDRQTNMGQTDRQTDMGQTESLMIKQIYRQQEAKGSILFAKTLTSVTSEERGLVDVLLDVDGFSVQHAHRGDLTVCCVDGEPVSGI